MSNLDDDLEYHITFPSINDTDVPEILGCGDEFEACTVPLSLVEGCDEPIVFLIGWGGCLDKHLAKYVEIYKSKGFITIRYTAPNKVVFKNNPVCPDIAAKLLDLISEYELTQHKVFFHMFSNAGCLVYKHISSLIQTDPNYCTINVCGATFDSGPAIIRHSHAIAAYYASLHECNYFLRFLYVVSMTVWISITIAWSWITSFFNEPSVVTTYDCLKVDKARWPQLYLYSTADEICMGKDISELVGYRRAEGYDVTEVMWTDSPHVAHYKVHPEAYTHHCHMFVNECLVKEDPINLKL